MEFGIENGLSHNEKCEKRNSSRNRTIQSRKTLGR